MIKLEMSNKTIAIFLLAAIFISIVGTIVSLTKLGTLTHTGYATGTGKTELNLSSTTSIKFAVNVVNWSTGSVNTTGSVYMNCSLSTSGLHSAGCIGFNTWNNTLIIENDGNTILSLVQVNSNVGNTTFPGGTQVYGGPQFMWNFSQNESSSCGNFMGNATLADVNTSGPPGGTCDAGCATSRLLGT